MKEITSNITKRIMLKRDIVQGLKANIDKAESKLIIACEKQLDYLLEKLTRCVLDANDMYQLKMIGEMIEKFKKLSLKDQGNEHIVNNNLYVNVSEVEDLKQIAKGS